MWLWFLFGFIALIASALYFIARKRVAFKSYLIMNVLRIIFIGILIWLITNPVFVFKRTVTRMKKVYFLVDSSASMNIKDISVEGKSRIDSVNDIISGDLKKKLKKRNIEAEIIEIGDYPVKNNSGRVTASLNESKIISNLKDFFARFNDPDPARIFLVSDGQDTESVSADSIDYPYPVYTVGCGNPNKQKDVMIESIDAPSISELEQEVQFKLKIQKSGFPSNLPVTVKMIDESGNTLEEKKSDGVDFNFSYIPKKVGLESFRFEVSTDGLSEPFLANNIVETGLLVRKNFIRIMVLGVPSWDLGFFIRSINGIKNVRLSIYNIVGTKKGEIFSMNSKSFENISDVMKSLPHQDMIVLSDVSADMFATDDLNELVNFVRKKGGGLMVFGGSRTLGSGNWQNTCLRDIIPVELIDNDFMAVSVLVNADKTVVSDPVLSGIIGKNDFSRQPPLYGLNVVHKIKPAARLILEGKTEQGGKVPVFAMMNCGAGKTALFCARNFYKWSTQEKNNFSGQDFLSVFFKNMIGYLAASDEESYISINIPGINYILGEKIPVEVTVLDRTYSPAKGSQVKGSAVSADGKTVSIDFLPVAGEPATFHSSFLAPEAGKYSIKIQATSSSRDILNARSDIIVHNPVVEFKYIEANWDLLEKIAKKSGGKFLDLDSFKSNVDGIRSKSVNEKLSITKLVIDYPFVLLFLIGIITLEWFLRIKNGLS